MIVAFLTIIVGLLILFSRYNFVAYVIGLEIILLGANLNVLFSSVILNAYITMINLVLLLIAAVETAIGLSLIINLHKFSFSIDIPVTGFKG